MGPAALLREPDGCREMVKGDDGSDPLGATPFDHALVMIHHGEVKLARFRLDACPFKGEAIAVQPHLFDEVDILRPEFEAVEGISRSLDIEGWLALLEQPEVGIDIIAFDLMPGRGGSPDEALGEIIAGFACKSRES